MTNIKDFKITKVGNKFSKEEKDIFYFLRDLR